MGEIREFKTGATRDAESGKLDYEAFEHPSVLRRYATYMHRHRAQPNGELRDGDNWQKGIPRDVYMKSAWRHFMDVWEMHRMGTNTEDELEEALCALRFNINGYLFEVLKARGAKLAEAK